VEHFFASAPRGPRRCCAAELDSPGRAEHRRRSRGVAFSGDWRACYAANLWSRIASRVLWRVAEFDYRNEVDLHEAARKVDWMRYFTVERTLRVNVSAQKSPLTSLDFATLRIKDAVCDRFREAAGSRPNIDRADPDVRVHAFLEAARGAFYLDTSGEPLFKRGWRAGAGEAPLRENLAAGIVMLSGWSRRSRCSIHVRRRHAAGRGRGDGRGQGAGGERSFGFEKLKISMRNSGKSQEEKSETPPSSVPLQIFGSDNDPRVLGDARRNIAAAGVDRWVRAGQADVLRARRARRRRDDRQPPYGERIGSRRNWRSSTRSSAAR
jgi:putative N6-adenine-specific DNA methylase